MIKHKDHFHGSDLEKIEEIYGIKAEDGIRDVAVTGVQTCALPIPMSIR